jgi:hypothetical protein
MTPSGAKDLLLVGVVGIGLYYVYKAISGAVNTATGAVNALTCGVSCGIAQAITWATTCSPISLNGNVEFPNGTQVSLNSLPVGQDSGGGVYVQYAGGVYQLNSGGSNSCGNWTASQVS